MTGMAVSPSFDGTSPVYVMVRPPSLDVTIHAMSEVTKGWQALLVELTDYTNRSIENGTAHVERLMGVRTFEQAFLLNEAYFRQSIDDYVLQLARVHGVCAILTRRVLDPFKSASGGQV